MDDLTDIESMVMKSPIIITVFVTVSSVLLMFALYI